MFHAIGEALGRRMVVMLNKTVVKTLIANGIASHDCTLRDEADQLQKFVAQL
jgi:hypothetical protein